MVKGLGNTFHTMMFSLSTITISKSLQDIMDKEVPQKWLQSRNYFPTTKTNNWLWTYRCCVVECSEVTKFGGLFPSNLWVMTKRLAGERFENLRGSSMLHECIYTCTVYCYRFLISARWSGELLNLKFSTWYNFMTCYAKINDQSLHFIS